MLQRATLKSIVGDSRLSRRSSHFHQLIQGNSKASQASREIKSLQFCPGSASGSPPREALRNHADRTSGSRLNWLPSMRRTGSSAFSYSAVNVTLGNNLCLICDSLWIQQFGVGLVSTTAQNLKMHACNIDLSNEVKQFDSMSFIRRSHAN